VTAVPTVTPTASATASPIPGRVSTSLQDDITTADTTVPVDDITLFPDSGTIQIDSEMMTYDGKQAAAAARAFGGGAGAVPGVLLNVQRGVNGTVAAAHAPGATVVLLIPICVGDCHGDDTVTVDELVSMVSIALGDADPTACLAGDGDGSAAITVDEIITAVNHALAGCPVEAPAGTSS
jgi:hypothetical protein